MTTDTPDWLTRAEAQHADNQQVKIGERVLANRKHVNAVNAKLAELGITPVRPAGFHPDGSIAPALLTEPDVTEDEDVYGVYATWDTSSDAVCLLVCDYRTGRSRFIGLRFSTLLRELADVAHARRNGPAGGHAAGEQLALRKIAENFVKHHDGPHTSEDADLIARGLAGLTAAVLYAADAAAARS